MTTSKTRDDQPAPAATPSRFQTPAVTAALDRLRRRYAGEVPSLDEVRRDLDQALGTRTLKELLDEVRGKY